MSEEFNKSIVRLIWKEIWQEGNLAAADELIDVNHVRHTCPRLFVPNNSEKRA